MQTVRVPLASNALYVSGTVNGVDKVWTREEGNWWSTTSDKAEDGIYRVVLSIIYGDGKTVTDSITLYYGLILITDRTYEDVANDTEKGYYNYVDLNRVGSAMAYLRDRLNQNGYLINISPKTYKEEDIQTNDDMILYLSQLEIIKSAIQLPDYTPNAPESMKFLTYQKANDIERILEIVDQMLSNSIESILYSGEIYSGEVI